MKMARIDTATWEAAVDDRGHWRSVVKAGIRRGEVNIYAHEAEQSEKRTVNILKLCSPFSTKYLDLA